MAQEIRLDAGGKLGKVERTPQGGARISASLARTGVLTYRNPDGSTRREFVPPDEAFRADALDAINGAPVIVGHAAWINPSNYKEHSVGTVSDGSVRRDGDLVVGKVALQDADALRRVDAGELTEISLGYSLDYDPTPGEYQGQRYDGTQRNRKVNHVALCAPGTSRAAVGFRFDSTDPLAEAPVGFRLDSTDPLSGVPVVTSTPQPEPQQPKVLPMKIRFDGHDYDLTIPAEFASYGAAVEKMREGAVVAARRADKAEGERDAALANAKKLEDAAAAAAKDTSRLDSLVAERVALEGKASRILGKDFKAAGKSNREIQIAVIRTDVKDFDGKDRPDVYIEARFDGIADKAPTAGSIADVQTVVTAPSTRTDDTRADEGGYIVDRLRRENDERMRTAWMRSTSEES